MQVIADAGTFDDRRQPEVDAVIANVEAEENQRQQPDIAVAEHGA